MVEKTVAQHYMRGSRLPVHLRFLGYIADPAEAIRQVNIVECGDAIP